MGREVGSAVRGLTPGVAWGRCGDGDRRAHQRRDAAARSASSSWPAPRCGCGSSRAGLRPGLRRDRRCSGRPARREPGEGAAHRPRCSSTWSSSAAGWRPSNASWPRLRRPSSSAVRPPSTPRPHRRRCRRRGRRPRRARRVPAVRRLPPPSPPGREPGQGHHPPEGQAAGSPCRGAGAAPAARRVRRSWRSARRPEALRRWPRSSATSPRTSRPPSS